MRQNSNSWAQIIDQIGPKLKENGQKAEETDSFAAANYDLLRQHKIFSAMVPAELGGGGASFSQMCEVLRRIATYHPSTALSCSMHQHIIAANVYNHLHGRPGKALLEKVAANELVLVSTGAGDWLSSTGELTKVDGGYLFNVTKHFCSGSPGGDLLVTSGPFEDPDEGWQVLHFPVPLKAEGVTVLDNWKAMGMRATGSDSVKIENVFVPEDAVVTKRPRGDYHAMWSTILPVALTLIMSVYTGIAQTAAAIAREKSGAKAKDPGTAYILGEMENHLTIAEMAHESMLALANDFDYEADLATANEVLKRKTIAVDATRKTVEKAVESQSGGGYIRAGGLENLLRDVQASHFHPLQEKRQLLFTGSLAMGEEPPAQAF
jgi:alkylation response protein AidB-like acyl-CoA dehydrogenase